MKNIFITALLFATISIFSQNNTCSNFKTGEFKFANPKYSEWIVIRNDSVQVEISNKSGMEIFSSIEWTNDCNFILTCYKVLNADKKNIIGKVFNVTINETYIDSYKCVTNSTNYQMKELELEMIKLK
ncbi:hypothetical protein [uncultured Algibacter sp.]|uniref:hypothetical protein n=1 Tax=uncultured Algibacter sp. TaxID=298659 RepID=UPI00260484B1|nr:hypothetical protein [uncultured Algibacter sp.]